MEQESEHSDEEEEYTYCLRTIPVYHRERIRPPLPQSKPHRELSAVAPEFQPSRRVPETAQRQQPLESEPVAESDPVQVQTPAATPPAEELQEEPARDDTMEEAGSEEQGDNSVPVTEPPGEEAPPVRRSTRAIRSREMLTYDHLGQPSYQPWRPGANLMFACVPYHMPYYPAVPGTCYYPPVWAC